MESDWTYLIFRTKLQLAYSQEAVEEFRSSFLRFDGQLFGFGNAGTTFWRNGFVFRTAAWNFDLKTLVAAFSNNLSLFDSWAVYDGRFFVHESIMDGGPIKTFLNGKDGRTIRQIYFQYDPDNPRQAASVEHELPGCFQMGADARCVFHFGNGGIMLVAAKDPAYPVFGRCERIGARLPGFALVDYDGETRSIPNPNDRKHLPTHRWTEYQFETKAEDEEADDNDEYDDEEEFEDVER